MTRTIGLSVLQSLKISAFTRGIGISRNAEDVLTQHGTVPLSTHEYPTTGGVTLRLEGDIYINAPFDNGFGEDAEALLDFVGDADGGGSFRVVFHGHEWPAEPIPLPGYLNVRDSWDQLATDLVYSHADRARLSPVQGCAMTCQFCDFPGRRYPRPEELPPIERVIETLEIAKGDRVLPVRHVLISGGTPGRRDYGYFDDICAAVGRTAGMPVDVMMPPRREDPGFIDRLVDLGVHGFSINLEVYDEELGRRITPQKQSLGRAHYAQAIERALERTGGRGRVRSLILVGLEPLEQTLQGVEFLARLGCDPVLSPFRPGPGTVLVDEPAPPAELLERVLLESLDIVERFGVKLGPRCIPCQHNTLTFPDESGAYYYY